MPTAPRALRIVLLVVASLMLVLTLVVNFLGTFLGAAIGRALGIFVNASEGTGVRDASNNRSSFSPAPYAFSVWGLIYLYQVAWLAFCWSTVCRRLFTGGPYLCQYLAPVGLFVWYCLSCLCNMAWIILADRVTLNYSLRIPQACVLIGIAVTLYGCLVSSYWSLAVAKKKLASHGKRLDFWLTIILVQNGISLYAGWVTVASFINVELVLLYVVNLEPPGLSGAICLSVLLALITAYAVADLTILDRLTRFVFTPHLVVIWAGAASLVQNFQTWTVNAVLTVALISVVGAALVVKLIAACIRSRTSPLISGQAYQVKQVA